MQELSPRRVVTGHDRDGKAIVLYDEPIDTAMSMRPGQKAAVLWTSEGLPASFCAGSDQAKVAVATTKESGIVFRVIRYEPGVAPRVHRTHSLDYAVVLEGEIDMEMDDQVVTLRQGDFLVQQGTIHNWVNRSAGPCTMAFVLVAAHAVTADGGPLPAVG